VETDQPDPAPAELAAPLPPGAPPPLIVTPRMLDHMRGTKPWVRFLSVCMFIGSGVFVLLAFVVAIGGALSEEIGPVMGAVLGVVYVLLAVIYAVFAVFLHRYANAVRDLMLTSDLTYMETALGHQRTFWRMAGITTLVGLALYALGLAAIVIIGVLAALTS
jgi:hypothetical protein